KGRRTVGRLSLRERALFRGAKDDTAPNCTTIRVKHLADWTQRATDDGPAGNGLGRTRPMRTGIVLLLLTLVSRSPVSAADYPDPVEGEVTLPDFRFASGETLPAVRMHYRTLGTPKRDGRGVV